MAPLVVLATLAALAPNEAMLRLRARAEACIRMNASVVERSEPNLSEAAAFLLGYLCVEPISAFQRYRSNTDQLSRVQSGASDAGWALFPPGLEGDRMKQAVQAQQDRRKAVYGGAKVDPETGNLIFADAGEEPTYEDALVTIDVLNGEPGGSTASNEFRALAGRAVLDARQSRLAH